METIKYVKVYPKWHVAKGCALLGFGYMCYKAGKFIQKLMDGYDYRNGTITFEKKEEAQK